MKIQYVAQMIVNAQGTAPGWIQAETIYETPAELILATADWMELKSISFKCVVRSEISDIIGNWFEGTPVEFIQWLSSQYMKYQAENSDLRARLSQFEEDEDYIEPYDNCGWAGIYEPPV